MFFGDRCKCRDGRSLCTYSGPKLNNGHETDDIPMHTVVGIPPPPPKLELGLAGGPLGVFGCGGGVPTTILRASRCGGGERNAYAHPIGTYSHTHLRSIFEIFRSEREKTRFLSKLVPKVIRK